MLMPSPITHLAAGYAIYRLARDRMPGRAFGQQWRLPGLLIFALIFSMLPDLDSVAAVLLNDFGRFHNQGSHSLIVGLVVALVAGGLVAVLRAGSFQAWFLVALLAYELHVILDFLTWGRGVMLFWPLTENRYLSPLLLFFGLHWSDGLFSLNHVITVVTEGAVIGLAYGLYRLWRRQIEVKAVSGV
jgi:inner membrane protein